MTTYGLLNRKFVVEVRDFARDKLVLACDPVGQQAAQKVERMFSKHLDRRRYYTTTRPATVQEQERVVDGVRQ